MQALCFTARHAIDDHCCREKIGEVEEYAPILFSARTHERFARGAQDGGRAVKIQILKALNSFEKWLVTIEAARRAEGVDDPHSGQKRGV